VVGVGQPLRQPALAEQLVNTRPHPVHRQAGVHLWMTRVPYRIRGNVAVAARFDETEDAVVVGRALLHTAENVIARYARPAPAIVQTVRLAPAAVQGAVVTFWRIPEDRLAIPKQPWTLDFGGPAFTPYPERKCIVARVTQVSLVDDVDGSAASGTVGFSLDGKTYELDLSDKNAKKLRDAFGPSLLQPVAARAVAGGRAVDRR
jgi:Lsr2